jgi:4-hydroxybenzoate polyprenyltransferase
VNLLSLYVRMLRYRVALMMWMFMLLAVAYHGALERMSGMVVLAAVVLGSSYVGATTVNDIADKEIDLVNHPRDRGRPLVAGDADERALWIVHAFGNIVAVLAAAAMGGWGLAISLLTISIGYAYSVRPIRFSYRTYLAPLVLAVAYVLVPYSLGLVAAGARPTWDDGIFAGSLYVLFIARIVLKDFRDREGDLRFGKPTLLLRSGKDVVCRTSVAALLIANVLLLIAIRPHPLFAIVVEGFVVAVWLQLRTLRRTADPHDEQVAIGIAARAGNGMLVSALAWLALIGAGATLEQRLVFVLLLGAVYGASYLMLARHPEDAIIGYKG